MLPGTPPKRKYLLKYLTGREKKRREETMQRGMGEREFLFHTKEKGCMANKTTAHLCWAVLSFTLMK